MLFGRTDRDASVLQKNPKMTWQDHYAQINILDPIEGEIVTLNEVAASAWRLIDGTRSVGQIITSLETEYEIDTKTLRRDIHKLLGRLVKLELILEIKP